MNSIWVGEEEEQEAVVTPHGMSMEWVEITYKHLTYSYMLKWLIRAAECELSPGKLSSQKFGLCRVVFLSLTTE